MVVELCHKEKGLDMWESVRNLPCWCSHGLLPLCGTWQLVFVECGRSLNDSFGCVHFVSSPEIKHFQWMSTACFRQPLSLTPTLNSMLHSSLMTNVNSLMWLKECTSALIWLNHSSSLLLLPPLICEPTTPPSQESHRRLSRDVKGCQFSVVMFLMFLTQHQTRWSRLTLWCVILVV